MSVENNSQSISARSIPEKRKSDDPLGKRFNFDTGIEEMISDHKEFDLLKHNDVFYPDDDEESILFENENINKEQNEDSFDIVFESNCSSDNQSTSFLHVPEYSRNSSVDESRKKTLTMEDETDICKNNGEHLTSEFKINSSRKERTKRRLVGEYIQIFFSKVIAIAYIFPIVCMPVGINECIALTYNIR